MSTTVNVIVAGALRPGIRVAQGIELPHPERARRWVRLRRRLVRGTASAARMAVSTLEFLAQLRADPSPRRLRHGGRRR